MVKMNKLFEGVSHMSLNELLRHYRKQILGVSQHEMAVRLNISQSSISKYEQDGATIDSSMLNKIMNAYQIPKPVLIDALFEEKRNDQTISIHEQRKNIFEKEMIFFERLFEENPLLKRELYRLSNMNQKERDKHAKAIASMIKAHLSVQ